MLDLVPLNLLPMGETGIIRQVLGSPDHVHRLHEIGLHAGACIEVMQGGETCIVRVAEQRFCFRGDELMRVLVERGTAA